VIAICSWCGKQFETIFKCTTVNKEALCDTCYNSLTTEIMYRSDCSIGSGQLIRDYVYHILFGEKAYSYNIIKDMHAINIHEKYQNNRMAAFGRFADNH